MAVRPGEFETHIQDGIVRIRIHKAELKSAEAEHLVEAVFDGAGGDCERVLLNFAEVEYINSTVMSALSRISVARDLRVVGMQSGVERILDTMGLLQFLDRCPTEEAALQAFAHEAGGATPPGGHAQRG
jgi:anti-anti-sigma factor